MVTQLLILVRKKPGVEEVGAEEVIPEIKTCNNTSRVTSGTSQTEITRGTDATLNLSVTCMAYVDGRELIFAHMIILQFMRIFILTM